MNNKNLYDLSESTKIIEACYDRYILGDEALPDSVPEGMRPEIYNSWRRSKEHGVDPISNESYLVPEEELKASLDELSPYLEIAEPYLDNIYRFIRGSNFLLHVTDCQGILLRYYADDTFISNLFSMTAQLQIGSKRNESIAGTDSTSLCISLDRAVRVIGPEHYLKHNHRFFCSSAPIHDSNNRLLFILTIMGPVELMQDHTLGMAFTAASSIEFALWNHDHIRKLEQNNELLNSTLDGLNAAIMVTDRDNNVLNVNNTFLKMFNLTRNSCIDHNLSEIFNIDSLPQSIRDLDEDFTNIPCTIRTTYGFSFNTVLSTKTVAGENLSGSSRHFVFQEQQTVNKLVNEMTRSSAVFTFDSILGTSEPITKAKDLAASISDSLSNVLILGESGTGKELFAQSIHNASSRKDRPFIAVNCSSIPKDLIESELFGYDNGAFTGARKNGQPGKFELANQGTLFLDEIGDMPLELQSSLLRVLQTHEVTRLGSSKPIKLDVRIIAATNHDLKHSVDNGTFRNDLYYRLNVLKLSLPPLRQRPDDIPTLVYSFIDTFSKSLNKGTCTISDEAIQILCQYDWPGNVRELENVIERAINIVDQSEITTRHIPAEIIDHVRANSINGTDDPEHPQSSIYNIGFTNPTIDRTPPGTGSPRLSPILRERELLIKLLEEENGHVPSVAKHMDIPTSTLYRKLNQYKLRAKDFKKF